MEKYIFTMMIVAALASPAWAFGPAADTSNDTKVSGEEGITTEGSIDNKHNASDRSSKTATSARDKAAGETLRKTAQAMKSGSLDLTVSADVGFLRTLRQLEQDGVQPFAGCQVISHPRLPDDFGLNAYSKKYGKRVIINDRAGRLKSAAESNAEVASIIDEAPVRQYRDCLAVYGAVVKTAFEYLNEDIATLKFIKKKSVKGAIQEIRGIGFNDYLLLSDGAIRRAAADLNRISDKYQDLMADQTPCRFEGNLTTIQCGSAQVVLASKPTLTAAGIAIFGNGTYGGFSATYKISSGWSYSDAFEAMQSDTKSQKFAKEYAKSVEDSKSRGNSAKALLAEKSAYDRSKGSKSSLGLDKVMPNMQ